VMVFFFVDCGLRLTEEVGAGQEVVFTISGQLSKFYRRDNSNFFFVFEKNPIPGFFLPFFRWR
jgi:hypothetical protein